MHGFHVAHPLPFSALFKEGILGAAMGKGEKEVLT